jgi:hypothetical protein
MEALVDMTIIGIVATASMSCFLWLISGLTNTHCDMVRAVGSIYTHDEKNSLVPGLIMQFTAGLLMTYIYGIFLEHLDLKASYEYAILGMLMGFIHGLIVSLVLAKLLGEHHPVEVYQTVTKRTVYAHLFAHIVFGLVIGTMYGTFLAFN